MNNPSAKKDPRRKTLVIISLVYCAFLLALNARAPATDGDSFEYAGIARNILLRGEPREDLLRSYTVKDQPLPHPPAQRANLYSLALVPFYAVFRETQWTFTLPAILGLFLLPLATYGIGKKLFSPAAAFAAALLAMLSPSALRLYSLMDPGLPEVWQMIFYLCLAAALAEERFARAGVFMALAFLFNRNSVALIPAVALWLLLFRGGGPRLAPALRVYGAALALVSPFLIWTWATFGTPFYNEQFAGLGKVYGGPLADTFIKGELLGIIFNYDVFNGAAGGVSGGLAGIARVILANMRLATVGGMTSIFYIPGILQTVGMIMVPFFIIGAFKPGKNAPRPLLLTIIFFQFLLHALLVTYSDRYILCVLPLVWLICGEGLKCFEEKVSRAIPYFSKRSLAMSVVAFSILAESAGFSLNLLRLLENPLLSQSRELRAACDYIREETKPGDVIMTYPFISTHFLCERPTVPMPFGSLETAARVAAKYDVKRIIFMSKWPGDLFPNLPFAETVARGRALSLFKVRPDALRQFIENPRDHHITPLNPVEYFLSRRLDFEFAPPLYKLLSHYSRGVVPGIFLFLLTALLFVYFNHRPGFITRIPPVAVICAFAVVLSGASLARLAAKINSPPPAISVVEAEYFCRALPDEKRRHLRIVGTGGDAESLLPKSVTRLFGNTRTVTEAPGRLPPDTTVFVPIPPATSWLTDRAALGYNARMQKEREQAVERTTRWFLEKGMRVQPIYGGIFVY